MRGLRIPDHPVRLREPETPVTGPYQAHVSRLLRATRLGLGLSLSQVAALSDSQVTACQLGTWERNDRGITVEQLDAMARLYQRQLGYPLPLTEFLPDLTPGAGEDTPAWTGRYEVSGCDAMAFGGDPPSYRDAADGQVTCCCTACPRCGHHVSSGHRCPGEPPDVTP